MMIEVRGMSNPVNAPIHYPELGHGPLLSHDINRLLTFYERTTGQNHFLLLMVYNPDVFKTAVWVIDPDPEPGRVAAAPVNRGVEKQ
ncbi:MAG: hypothetical protein IPQ06_02920 [Chitinophagaceae bacterium]|nr:hypothetical protein [Chitinophagaceae bacterium]